MKVRWGLWAAAVGMAVILVGCGAKPAAEAGQKAAQGPRTEGNTVFLPAGSPMLNQIRTAVVDVAEAPSEEVDAPGRIEADPNRLSHVVLPITGRVTSVLVHLGDLVSRGQTLLMLQSPDADVALSNYIQAEAGVNTAKSSLLKAQADYDRSKDLFEHNAIAQKEVLNAESALAQAKAALDTAIAAREQCRHRLDLLGLKHDQFGQLVAVTAPISGKVLEISVAPNEYRNDPNASLMTIADLSQVWVTSDVPETQIRLIHVGEPVDVELEAWPGRIFRARVARIGDTVDPSTRTIKVHGEIPNPGESLRPEMFGRMRHVVSTRTLPVAPLAAIVQGDGQSLVYRQTGADSFERVPVELGARLGDRIAITRGVKPGDRIVVDGVMLLKAS